MAQVLLYLMMAVFAVMIGIGILENRRERRMRRPQAIHREPVIDQVIEIDHYTDQYYQPAESTDKPVSWIAHQFKRDPLIWKLIEEPPAIKCRP